MNLNDYKLRVLVFDTNILYEKGDNGCNFSDFKFNKLFQNVVDQLEERDLTEYIHIAIPEVVWKEMYYQRISLFKVKSENLVKMLKNYKFPFFEYNFLDGEYDDYLKGQIDKYQMKLDKFSTKILNFPLPSSNRFDSIIQRSFMKKPPFEGKEKKSDKGFKDALIWESILEYKASNRHVEICLYTRDGLFNEQLSIEYENLFNEKIELLNNEENVVKFMASIENNLNKFRQPNLNSIEPYKNLRSILTDEFIGKTLFKIELSHNIGSSIYDFSSSDNYKIKNIIDVSAIDLIDKASYEVLIIADLTFSNGENGEDIEVFGEEIKFEFTLEIEESLFIINKIMVLKNQYYIDNNIVGGELGV